MSKPRFVAIGEALVDVLPEAELPGGSPANVAVALSRLGDDATLVAMLADDERGELVRSWLTESGVKVSAAEPETGRTSTAVVSLDADGVASYVFDLTWDPPAELIANAVGGRSTPGADAALAEPSADILHIGSIASVLEPGASTIEQAVRAARERGVVVSFDPNARPSITPDVTEMRERVERLVGLSDIVKVSDEDIAWYYPEASPAEVAQQWARLGPEIVVVTLGGDGALAILASAPEQVISVPGVKVEVADTVGAGDTFMGALLDWLGRNGISGKNGRNQLAKLTESEVTEALTWATKAAAITVSRQGMNPPSRSELA